MSKLALDASLAPELVEFWGYRYQEVKDELDKLKVFFLISSRRQSQCRNPGISRSDQVRLRKFAARERTRFARNYPQIAQRQYRPPADGRRFAAEVHQGAESRECYEEEDGCVIGDTDRYSSTFSQIAGRLFICGQTGKSATSHFRRVVSG